MAHPLDQYDIESLQSGLARGGDGATTCLVCGAQFLPDEVYPVEGRFFTAQKAARHHAHSAHGSRLEALLATDSRYIPLTAHQQQLLRLFAAGRSDAEIAAEAGTSPATVRRQRFTFREKARQAKMLLALYHLASMPPPAPDEAWLPLPESVRLLDDRFIITREENDRYLKNAFSSLAPPRLRALPVKEKKKVVALNLIAAQFQPGQNYSEKEVNAILKEIHEDYVTIRRYLIEYGFLSRERDGSRYWKT